MAIDENDAFQVFNGIETMPEEMRPRAASLLADYKTQQESAGAPLWPTQEKIKQDRRKRVQEVFDNPLVLDADNGAFVEANKVKPGIGDNLRSREASILWLADRYNADEADVRKRYDFYKADQSQKWGHQTLDDATFFNKAKADNDAEIVRTDKRKQATLTGIESALSGASMASELGRFLEAYPDSTEEEKLTFASTLAQTTGVLAPHKRLIDSAAPAMRRIQKGEATDSDMQTVEELAWTLAQSQGRDRQILMRSLLMGAKKVAEEGGKRDVSGTFAGSALNLIEGMYGSGRRGEDVARRIDPSQPLPIGEPITSVQDALKAMDAMARADIASRVPYDPNAPELPASRVLSDEEKDFVIEAKDRVKSLFKTERELKKIALSTDPMDDSIMGTMASGSASSLSLMLPLAMGPQGLLMAGGGYANMEREELLTEFPDMDPGDASRIAVLSGAVQAAGDKAALFGLDKFAPNVRKMIVGGVTKEFIKKAAIQGTAVFVFENTVEAAQDLSTPVIQTMVADLKATVPQVDWQKERDEFLGTRADVAIGMVPLMLLGAGVNTAANKQQINQMLSDNDLLMRAGIIQEDRVKILELSTAGKTDEAQAWLKDSMGRRSPELAAEVAERYASKMEALRKTQDQAIALQTTLPEYTASVTRTPSGWQVTTGDGTIIPVESAEAARRIAVDLRQVGSQQEADALVNVIDGYYAAGKRVDTVFTGEDVKASETVGVVATRRDANNALLSQRQFGPQALETVRAEAEIAGIKSDTRNIFAHVNGSNEAFPMRVADGAKGVTRILNLYRSQEESQPQVITFLHENIESSWRLGMANSTFSEQETRTAFSALLPAFEGIQTTDALELQFIDNVRQLAAGKGNDTMMRETVSEMVVRDVLGRDRDGRATGMKPGSISRAIEASVMGANTQEQVSALKSILAAIKAFTVYLKAVFSTVDAISTARDEGKLGEDWIGFVDKVLGIDEVKRDEGLAMNEAQAILEDSDMPFSISPASTASVPTSDIDTIPEDLSRAEADMKAGGKDWAAKVDLSQPVGVYRGEDGRLKLFDGHHRWLAARERGEPLQVRESVFVRAVPIGEAPVVADMPDGAQLVGPATFSITAYHGTPHKVDKFTTAKIGTGEGAQAFGWGLYFAESRDVGEQYRKELSRIVVPDDVAAKSDVHKALAEMVNEGMDIGVAADKLRKFPWDQVREARDEIAKLPRSGNLYTVELLPDADDFLDWDKPLSEQSEKVKAALASTGLFTPRDLNPPANFVPSPLFNSGRGAYDILKSNEESDEKASKLLASLGIAGMKYFDGNSRNIEFGTSNYVIFDESLVKILEENGQKVEGQSFSISPAQDAEFLAAAKAGDVETAQRLVDEAINDNLPIGFYHGGNAGEKGFIVQFVKGRPDESYWAGRTKDRALWQTKANRTLTNDMIEFGAEYFGLDTQKAEKLMNPENIVDTAGAWDDPQFVSEFWQRFENDLIKNGDAFEVGNGAIAFPGSEKVQRISDPITYDDAGNVIPLSQRFNEATPDIRFSISPIRNLNELSDQVERQFKENPVEALEVKTKVIRQFTKIADKWSNERWTPQGNKIRPISDKRTVKSLDKEQAYRKRARQRELIDEGMNALTPDTLMAWSQGVDTLSKDPLIAKMLNDNGKLMSKSTAEDEGRNIKDQYDDAGWIPPQWYAKAGGIMPDVMANNLGFDTASEMWAALESSIKSHRNAKEGYAKAEAAVKAVEKAAFEQARKEAQAWRDEADAMQKEDWSPKESLVRDLITLEAIVAMFPQEVRGKIGGFVTLARKASESARLKVLQKQLERGQVLLEKHLKEQYGEAVDKLFDKYRPTRKAGEKPKGKLDPDAQEIADKAEAAMGLNADQTNAEIAAINALLDADNISAEDEVKLERMRELVQLLGDWKNADSAKRESAFIALNDVLTEGWAKWKLKQLLKREQREEMRKMLKSATGKKGVASERDKMKIEAAKTLGKATRWVLNLSSFGEVMKAVFGEKVSRQFIDNERNASNQYEDAIQDFSERIDEFFTTLTGGVLRGERLRFDLAQPSLIIGAGGTNERNISQLQGIQALLMWQQEDGKRHMEGPRDESGAPIEGKWSYDQSWIDELTSKLTPEAVEVKKFLEQLYGEEWVPLNEIYRERHGVNLPRHDKYAPITVTPQQAKAGEMTDPVSGAAIAGSILTPGSLRSRNRSALAEPEFRDALSTFIAHTKQMEHWKAYYDLAIDMQSALGNRDVSNSVKSAVGEEGVKVLRKWVDVFAQGGTRDAAAGLAVSDGLGRLSGRVATVGLLGRFSTLLVQSGQLAAASVKMPVGSYLKRFALLMSGNLQWADAINSEFIQRRIKSAPPLIRQAMQNLGEATRPNQIQRVTRHLGQLLSGADGLFTAGTYAILLDYHRMAGAKMGMEGEALESYAHAEAVNATEQVAQPVRTGTRSIIEVTNTNPIAKMSWAYASEARQKMALFAWSAYNAKNDPAGAAKTAFLVFVIGGLMSQVLKNLWREAKGDDDEKKWSPERLTLATLSPITSAIPGASMLAGEGGSLSGAEYAKQSIKDVFDGKADMKDVDTILSVMGYFNDTAGGIATLSHAGYDFAKVLENAFGDE